MFCKCWDTATCTELRASHTCALTSQALCPAGVGSASGASFLPCRLVPRRATLEKGVGGGGHSRNGGATGCTRGPGRALAPPGRSRDCGCPHPFGQSGVGPTAALSGAPLWSRRSTGVGVAGLRAWAAEPEAPRALRTTPRCTRRSGRWGH